MSVLVSHPSVAPFIQEAALAFHEAGMLERFITTFRRNPQSSLQKCAITLAALLGRDLDKQLRRRAIPHLPSEKVESHPWGECVRLLASRLEPSGRLGDLAWSWSEPAFDRMVARRLSRSLSAVYGYEYSSRATFQKAKELGVPVVYEVPAPEPRFVQSLLDAQVEAFPELRTAYHAHTAAREENRTGRRRAEWHLADRVICASQFTLKSYAQAGLDTAKVRVVPYGAPPPAPRESVLGRLEDSNSKPLFMWAGTFSIRKGAHLVMEAWRRGNFGRHARLRVFGSIQVPERIWKPVPEGAEFLGSIPHHVLMQEYPHADALLFPTLCDGFGLVATEAWSRGVPVIITDRAGATELLKPRENGLLIGSDSSRAIEEALDWCLTHRTELRSMRAAAWDTAASWQWHDYRLGLRRALADRIPFPNAFL